MAEGEIAEKTICRLNDEEIGKESMRDGFHSMCMSLSDETVQIIRNNKASLGD